MEEKGAQVTDSSDTSSELQKRLDADSSPITNPPKSDSNVGLPNAETKLNDLGSRTSDETPTKKRESIRRIVIFAVILVFAFGLLLLMYTKYNPFRKSADKTKVSSTPTSTQDKMPLDGVAKIPESVDYQFSDTLKFVANNIKDWGPDYVIDKMSFTFGENFSDLNKMYETGNVDPSINVSAYSPKRHAQVIVRGSELNSLNVNPIETSMSDWGQIYKNLSQDKHLPKSPKETIKNCLSFAESRGNYALYKCSYAVDVERAWVCEFIDVNKASSLTKPYVSSNISHSCYYNPETQSVENWLWELGITD